MNDIVVDDKLEAQLARMEGMCGDDVVAVPFSRAAELQRSLVAQNVPSRYVFGHSQMADSWQGGVKELRGILQEMAAVGGRGCLWVLCGGVGTGKTTLAVDLALCGAYEAVRWFSGDSLWREYNDQRERRGWDAQDYWLRQFGWGAMVKNELGLRVRSHRSLLVVDECQLLLSSGMASEISRRDVLHRIVDDRLGNGLDTVLIGNWDFGRVATVLGDSIADRVRFSGNQGLGGFYHFEWGSLR